MNSNTAFVLRKEGSGLTRTWLRVKKIRLLDIDYARMAELADAPDSKSGSRKRVGVRPSLWAPSVRQREQDRMGFLRFVKSVD